MHVDLTPYLYMYTSILIRGKPERALGAQETRSSVYTRIGVYN